MKDETRRQLQTPKLLVFIVCVDGRNLRREVPGKGLFLVAERRLGGRVADFSTGGMDENVYVLERRLVFSKQPLYWSG
jgi:hypothetical protein